MTGLRYIALGAGVQSTAMLILSCEGKIRRADVAIFADTQDEPQWVYDHLERLENWSSIPIERISHGKLSSDILKRNHFAPIPAFSLGSDGTATPLRRQCTREYKITPIERKVRELLGYKKGQVVKDNVTAMIGISMDEQQRMKESRIHWIMNDYPLIDCQLNRRDCLGIAGEYGFKPKKSSCVFCPFHSDRFWLDLRENHPDEWDKAVEFDAAIRHMSMSGMKRPIYVHPTLRPLPQVELKHEHQLALWEECEGVCGV